MNLNGYETFTTFWHDFEIAEKFGVAAIRDTFQRVFAEWKHDYKYLTELVMVLNHKCWDFYNQHMDVYSQVYAELYYQAHDYALENLNQDEIAYYFRITD